MRALSERIRALNVALLLTSFAGAMGLMSGCGGVNVTNPDFYAAISASASTVRVNQTVQTIRASQATGAPLTYSVNGVQGGNTVHGACDRPYSKFGNDHQRCKQLPELPAGVCDACHLEPDSGPQYRDAFGLF